MTFAVNGSLEQEEDGGCEEFAARMARLVRLETGRSRDVVVDAAYPSASMEELEARFGERIGRFSPDVLVLSCGHRDALLGTELRERFESSFVSILRRAREAGVLTVVHTPPFVAAESEQERVDQLICLEAIRGCAAEQGAVLVDQWAHSEAMIGGGDRPSDWSGAAGLSELARHFAGAARIEG